MSPDDLHICILPMGAQEQPSLDRDQPVTPVVWPFALRNIHISDLLPQIIEGARTHYNMAYAGMPASLNLVHGIAVSSLP